jgi:F0F1-type ATP synthase membrane subunit b/b'
VTEKSTIKEIENRLRNDRADLASTLADLAGRIAPEYLSEQVSQMVKDYARPAAKKAEEAVRANPVGFAVAGAGLAWLLLSARKDGEETPVRVETDPITAQDGLSDAWLDEIDELREAASDRLQKLEIDAASNTEKAADYASERARMVSDFASDLRDSLQSGLGDLGDEARDRVVRAREAAYSARLNLQDRAKETGHSGKKMIKDHPLITAALGIAIGAAIVNAMPKPDLNRRSFGPRTNRLIDEARSIYDEEKSRLKSLADTVGKEVKRTARSVADTATDEASKTARDISDQAMSAGQELSERLAQQLADEASKAIKDVGAHLRARGHDGVTH